MKRSTLVAVTLTALVLVVAGNLARLPHGTDATALLARSARAGAAWSARAFAAPRTWRLPRLAAPAWRLPSFTRTSIARPGEDPGRFTPFARPTLLVSGAPRGSRGASLPLAAAIAGGLAVALIALVVTLVRVRRDDRHGVVWRLARRGHDAARIASRARVPQDAVRTLLTPGIGARR